MILNIKSKAKSRSSLDTFNTFLLNLKNIDIKSPIKHIAF